MMNLILNRISKRYNNQWIFRDLDFNFDSKEPSVLLGRNGSGKTTLLQIIAGYLKPNTGEVIYDFPVNKGQKPITRDTIFRRLSWSAPYINLLEEFTFSEMLHFQFGFKKIIRNMSIDEIIELSGLATFSHKQLKHFSSGMKQRVNLLLALYAQSELLILDEPTTNLDDKSIEWYMTQLCRVKENRIVIIATNQFIEKDVCTNILNVEKFI